MARASAELLDRLLAGPPRLELDDWALARPGLELVAAEILAGRREIVECGSGVSTIAIARLLRELGEGSLHSLEHDPAWAQLGKMRLASEGLSGIAKVIEAPLGAHPLAPAGCRWYEPWALAELPEAIDLLLVDGPPAGDLAPERGRYPALPALADRLAPDAAVILDDAERPGERWVLERWRAELGFEFERKPEAGVAISVSSRPSGDSAGSD
jgi:predicted O-methyltransferase YrrM